MVVTVVEVSEVPGTQDYVYLVHTQTRERFKPFRLGKVRSEMVEDVRGVMGRRGDRPSRSGGAGAGGAGNGGGANFRRAAHRLLWNYPKGLLRNGSLCFLVVV